VRKMDCKEAKEMLKSINIEINRLAWAGNSEAGGLGGTLMVCALRRMYGKIAEEFVPSGEDVEEWLEE